MRARGTIKSRSPGSYRIRYTLGRDPVSGKRRFGTATVRGTRKEAEQELVRLLRAVHTGEHVDPSRVTVGDWLGLWIASTRAEVSPKTHERYAEIVRCYLVPALGAIRLQRLTASDIQRGYNGFTRTPSPRTRRHIHRILKSALARAVEQQALPRNPAEALKRLPKVEAKPIAVLTVEQSTKLLQAIKHTTTYWPVLIALATGMRRGEILALRWKNVELEQGVVRVVGSLEQTRKGGLRFKATKTEKARAVTLPRFAVEELRRWKREQAEGLFAFGVRQKPDTLVCARQDGEPKQPGSLTHEFTYLVGRADIPRVRFHDLRHSHATQLLASGVHPKIVQERLGHSTITVTMDLYSHVSETMQSDAAAKLDQAYAPRSW
jgi:integrase